MSKFTPVIRNVFYLILLLLISACQKENKVADLIVTDATIWTGNPDQPLAQALAISGDTILGVGSNEDVLKFKGETTKVENANGKFITPGFIDAHVHFLGGGFNLASVKLRDANTSEEFAKRISDFAKTTKPGTWIVGGEWDGKAWGMLPDKNWIDSVTKNHPIFLMRLDGHMGLANSLALKLVGIDNNVKDIMGGTIVRNKKGELTGVFKDNAMTLILDKIPPPSAEEIDNALQEAMKYVASNGVTTVHNVWNAGDPDVYTDGIERARKNNSLITRIYDLGSLKNWQTVKERVDKYGRGDKWLSFVGVKGFVDGSLGSQTAAFREPYVGFPNETGLFLDTKEDLYNYISEADKAGLHIAVHAIGDDAINFLLNTFEKVATENGPRNRRFRIEHVQHLAKEDVPRFAQLNVIASMQPYHAIDDGRWAEKSIGPERIKTTYAFKSLLDANAILAFGSDWYVAPPTPLEGIYAAVTRRTIDDKNPDGWVPEQKITVEQALVAYTRNGAYASFEENIKGSLEPGKLADFVIISEDITKIDPVKIRDTKILQTYVGGKKVFESKDE